MYKTEAEFGHNLIDFWKMSSLIELKLIARKNKTLRFRLVYGIKEDLNKLNNYTAEWVFQLIINYLIENRFSEKFIKAEEPFWICGLKNCYVQWAQIIGLHVITICVLFLNLSSNKLFSLSIVSRIPPFKYQILSKVVACSNVCHC